MASCGKSWPAAFAARFPEPNSSSGLLWPSSKALSTALKPALLIALGAALKDAPGIPWPTSKGGAGS